MIEKLGHFSAENLQRWAHDYLAEVKKWSSEYKLESLLNGPVDHLAIKAANREDYLEYLKSLSDHQKGWSEWPNGGRRLLTAELDDSIDFGSLGETRVLEVMEPRPERVGVDVVGFEHIELFRSDLNPVINLLNQHNVEYVQEDNGEHQAVVVKINSTGQELKFTDSQLLNITARQLVDGRSIIPQP